LQEPAFPKADLKRARRFRELFFTVDGPSNLGRASQMALSYGWFPADHAYGARPVLEDVRKVGVKDLRALHASWLEMSPITVLVVGDVTWDEVKPMLEPAVQGLGAEGEQRPDLPVDEPSGVRVIGIDGPGETQARIRLRTGAPWQSDEDRVAADMMVWAFGGHFLSRLNRNLREDKGFTYGSRARYSPSETRGHVTVSVDVKAQNVEATIREIVAEMDGLVTQGVTEEELGASALEKISSWNNVKESARTAGGFYLGLLYRGETVADAEARGRKTLEVTLEDTRAVAKDRFGEDGNRLWVVAGDRQALDPQLEALGFEVQWITPEQAVLGTF
jgi:zinc protease